MAIQYLNTEKLQDKKAKLETHKINVLDYLTKIKEERIVHVILGTSLSFNKKHLNYLCTEPK